jgi:hypothetical protein
LTIPKEFAPMTSEKQIAANRENAQHSTGPSTAEGKARSAINAVKSGLTGRTILLPNEDVPVYEAHVASLTSQYAPVGYAEQTLVQSIADAEWRLQRIPSLEFGFYAMGNIEFGPLFANQPEHLHTSLIQNRTYVTYQKELRNLQVQEIRILRHRDAYLRELVL